MLRHVLVFLAGVPAGIAFWPYHDIGALLACIGVSLLALIAAWQAPDSSRPGKALEKRLNGLRIVGREEDR